MSGQAPGKVTKVRAGQIDRRTWATRQELRTAIVTWIEKTYHRRRRQAALGRLTPVKYETVMTTPAIQAA
ncbi:IS3 family transposase [Streptomyces olivaceus]|uniref:IS3 family transposase n=1 Tax=Streptomyces olivaceus TaxID=47716 RepID=UPI003570F3DF